MIIKDLQLYKEDDKYYLSALFSHEDKNGYYELSVPKIVLPISECCAVNQTIDSYDYRCATRHTVSANLGFGELSVKPFDDDGNFFKLTCLEEKRYKMTLSEIEKALGYKIELQEESANG